MENNGEESDEESHKAQTDLMKQHIEEQLAIIHGQKLDWEGELESVSTTTCS
jgi:hypothetical protein